jgi:hypothetical protein
MVISFLWQAIAGIALLSIFLVYGVFGRYK